MKNEREYLKWEGMLTLATTSPGGKVQRDMLALLIYDLVLFPKALGCIDIAVLDLFDHLDGGLNPVHDDDLVWRAPWLQARNVLYRCGEHSWVPLVGLWGHLAYAPLLVLRQYGSTQFVPAKKGLKDFYVNYETYKGYKVAVYNASVAWNHIRRVRIFSAPYLMTPEYEVWRFHRLNDKVPNMNSEGTQSVQERLAILPREVDLIREQLEEEQEQCHKLERKFEQERSDFRPKRIK
ncbi:hypothetical protein GQ457_16G014050 [Hibiscus cannabinus]